MKGLIVNADDFGAGSGINRGVIDAHRRGIVTSASMMVDAPASAEAAKLGARHPALSVGLHVVLRSPIDPTATETQIERQLSRFVELTGQAPTHIDSHHTLHREVSLLPAFLSVAEHHALPLRGHCGVRHIASFYGQSNGETRLESVGPDALARILLAEVDDGFNELCCHPGYIDPQLASSYSLERQTELETLCDPRLAALLEEQGIQLKTFRDLERAL